MLQHSPKHSVLYQGCVLSSIVNAVSAGRYASSTFYHSLWQNTYLYDGTDGNYATVIFEQGKVMGSVYEKESERSLRHRDEPYDLSALFRGMPASHQPLADLMLSSWHTEINGQKVPFITAAFWNEGEYLTAAEPWEDVYRNGGELLRIQLLEDPEKAIAEWKVNCQLTSTQTNLARSLFYRKMSQPDQIIVLTPDEVDVLLGTSTEAESLAVQLMQGLAGPRRDLEPVREAFEGLGIHFPPETLREIVDSFGNRNT
jgi:hypothetical protein